MANAREAMPVNATAAANKFSLLALLAGERYEVGLSKIAGDKYGQPQARGLAVPHRRMVRDLGVSTSAAGGALASATDLQRVAAAVRPAVVLEQMGAERIEVSGVAEAAFPRFAGGVGGWLAEGEASPSDNATIESVVAVPHCAAARLGMSRRVRNQAREDVESAVLREVEQCVGATLESGFLTGSGSNDQPLGVINVPGIGTESFAGAVPTFAELESMVGIYAAADGDINAARWLLNTNDFASLLSVATQYIDGAHRICGLPVFSSSHLTQGKHLLMDPSAVALIYFGGAQVTLDTFSSGKALTGAAEVVVFNYADVAILRPAHVVVGSA
jgi:HK97 family phage major capsid protein